MSEQWIRGPFLRFELVFTAAFWHSPLPLAGVQLHTSHSYSTLGPARIYTRALHFNQV